MNNNIFTSLNSEYWSKELQKTYFVENTAVFLAGTRGVDSLSSNGRKFHIPILTHIADGTYTPGTDIVDTDLISSDQELEVNTFKYGSAYIDDVEVRQSLYDAAARSSMSIMRTLNNRIEQAFLNNITSAQHTVDAGSVGGSSGSNIDLSQSNAVAVFTAGHTKLDLVDAPMANRVAVVGAHTVRILREVKGNRETMLGDSVLQNGLIGSWQGWQVVQNNNLPWSATLTINGVPTAAETVTIAGVVFTFVASIGSTAGNVLIGTAAETRANLKAAVEAGSGAGTTYIEVSAENRHLLRKRNVACTSAEAMSFTGNGDLIVSETATNVAWSAQLQSSWFGLRGATDMVVQLPVRVETTRVEKRFGTRVKALVGYGVKTFDDGARGLVRVKISASSWA